MGNGFLPATGAVSRTQSSACLCSRTSSYIGISVTSLMIRWSMAAFSSEYESTTPSSALSWNNQETSRRS